MNSSRKFDIAAGVVVLLVFLITVYLTKEFLTTILLSIVLVYLLGPLYAAIFRLTQNRQVSSFFSILVVSILILVFILVTTNVLIVEISNLQKSGAISSARIADTIQWTDIWAKSMLPASIYNYILETIPKYRQNISDVPIVLARFVFPILEKKVNSFASSLPVLFAQLILLTFFIYYILIDGKEFIAKAVDLFPSEKQGLTMIFLQELNSIYTTLFTVYFTTSMLSGVLAAIGFSLLGVRYPILLGAIVGFFTFMPMLGPPFVFVPMALYYLSIGDTIRCLIILVFGILVLMILPENIIRPHLAQRSARIHPMITLLAYTAPIFVVGIIGVIIGPALYGFLLAVYRSAIVDRNSKRQFDEQP